MYTADMVRLGQRYIQNFHKANASGTEWHGACPKCGGKDRFVIWPKEYRYFCRQCGEKGDAIAFVMLVKGLTFKQAKADSDVGTLFSEVRAKTLVRAAGTPAARVDYPCFLEGWQMAAKTFIRDAKDRLWSRDGSKALRYLKSDRKLTEAVIADMGLGYLGEDYFSQWGDQIIRLPRGIIIPWVNAGKVWRVNCRPPVPVDGRKYIQASGGANGLYNADALSLHRIAVLVEGEFDAMTVLSHAPRYTAVGTGTVSWARTLLALTQLSIPPLVLLGFDSDEAGDSAADYWQEQLGERAMRVRPAAHDANDLARLDVRLIEEWLAPERPPEPNGWPSEALRKSVRTEMEKEGWNAVYEER